MTLNEFIVKTHADKEYNVRPRIICNDGFKMSVQGSRGHYCKPRHNEPYYSEMEVGYPSEVEESILEYAENVGNPTDSVYGWVPVEIIQNIIDKHGGIDLEQTFKSKKK